MLVAFRCLGLALLLTGVCSATTTRPHILSLIIDDLGFFDTTVHNPNAPTPAIKNLTDSGIRLEHHYSCECASFREFKTLSAL